MRRREFITLLGGAAVAWPLAAGAQQPAGKVWRIGMLETVSRPLNAANFAAFQKGLRELGYVEGQNLLIEYHSADGRAERFPDLASELVRLKVDAIVTRGTPAGSGSEARDHCDSNCDGRDWRTACHRCCRQSRAPGWQCHRVELLCHRTGAEARGTDERDDPRNHARRGSL